MRGDRKRRKKGEDKGRRGNERGCGRVGDREDGKEWLVAVEDEVHSAGEIRERWGCIGVVM